MVLSWTFSETFPLVPNLFEINFSLWVHVANMKSKNMESWKQNIFWDERRRVPSTVPHLNRHRDKSWLQLGTANEEIKKQQQRVRTCRGSRESLGSLLFPNLWSHPCPRLLGRTPCRTLFRSHLFCTIRVLGTDSYVQWTWNPSFHFEKDRIFSFPFPKSRKSHFRRSKHLFDLPVLLLY